MHAAYDHPHLHGDYGDRLRHVSYFLARSSGRPTPTGLPARAGPLLRHAEAAAAHHELRAAGGEGGATDRHGFFSLGTNADYSARFLGEIPVFLEVNPNMPRSFGENNVHVSQIVGWSESDYPLLDVAPAPAGDLDRDIAALVAERIADGATIQAGIGGVPNALMPLLGATATSASTPSC